MTTITEKIKDKKRAEIKSLAHELISYPWNSTSRAGNVSRIIRILGEKQSAASEIGVYLRNEKERMDKGHNSFESYYGRGIIETFDKLYAAVDKFKNKQSVLSTDELVSGFIFDALHDHYEYREFNWKNYLTLSEKLRKHMPQLIGEFDTYFRGDIAEVHMVYGGKYMVIESKRHPYDYEKQRTKRNEPEETQFYAWTLNKEGNYRHDSTVYHTFEESLFSVICPTHSGSMSVLWKSHISEEK